MKIREILAKLQPWADMTKRLESHRKKQGKAIEVLTNGDARDVDFGPYDDQWEAYTRQVSESVGDRSEWLLWYAMECDMGNNPRMVTTAFSFRSIKVRTLRQLAQAIASDMIE